MGRAAGYRTPFGPYHCPPVIPWHTIGYSGLGDRFALCRTTERVTRLLLATIIPFQVNCAFNAVCGYKV